ncbi:ankyrin repeat-containing domain protein [Zopfochytrium polystomum]|nr:ankyrin repeat-containing domain protein [Zopfochytrium polystomum]
MVRQRVMDWIEQQAQRGGHAESSKWWEWWGSLMDWTTAAQTHAPSIVHGHGGHVHGASGSRPPPPPLDLLIRTLVGVGAYVVDPTTTTTAGDVGTAAAAAPVAGHSEQAVLGWLLQNADANVDAIQTLILRQEFPRLDRRAATAGLCRAACRGLQHLAEFFVGCGADVNGFNEDADDDDEPVIDAVRRELPSLAPLTVACSYGHLDIVKLLVKHGASLDTRDCMGRNPLYCAALRGRIDLIDYLVMKGADVNATSMVTRDSTPFFAACQNGHTDAAKVLLDHGANPANLAHRDAAIAAAQSGCLETLQFVLERGSRLATLARGATAADSDDVGMEALRHAAHDRIEVVRWLSNYIDADHTTKHLRVEESKCPLYAACAMGRESVVEFLLDEGWQTSDFDELFDVAARMGHAEVVKLLLHRKAMHQSCRAANHNCEWFGDATMEASSLIQAARRGLAQTVQAHLDYGTDVDCCDEYDRTALHHACERGRLEVVIVLLDAGANMYKANKADMTAMETAKAKGHSDIVEVLFQRQLRDGTEFQRGNGI